EKNYFMAFLRRGETLGRIRPLRSFVSPRTGVRFEPGETELLIYRPGGERFQTYNELENLLRTTRQQADQLQQRLARFAELSRKARRGLATAEEERELEHLEQQLPAP